MQVNPLTREVLVKLVYYGPGLGGKTTSLQRVHQQSPVEARGQLVSLATPVDRTLYFDFLPIRVSPLRGYHIRLQLFTVPGQVYFNATRKLVLSGSDGVVFVADSHPHRRDANIESLENLIGNLEAQGRRFADVPIVFQYNKRDLPQPMTLEEMDECMNPLGAPAFPTSALRGDGVMEALDTLVRVVLERVADSDALQNPVPIIESAPPFERTELALEEQIGRASEEIWRSTIERALEAQREAGRRSQAPVPHRPSVSGSLVPTDGIDGPRSSRPSWRSRSSWDVYAQGRFDHDVVERHSLDPKLDPPSAADGDAPPEPPADAYSSNGFATDRPAPTVGDTTPPVAARADSPRPSSLEPRGYSLAPFFGTHADRAANIELHLAHGRFGDAVRACRDLAYILLSDVAPTVDAPTALLLMGVAGERWLRVLHAAERAEAQRAVELDEACVAFSLVMELEGRRRSFLR